VVSIRGGDWYFVEPRWWGRMLLRRVFDRSAGVVVQADRIGRAVHGKYPAVQPLTIPNGAEKDDRQASGDKLLFVGNLLRRKGVHVLLEAMRELPDIPLVIAGDGPERAALERQAAGLNVEFLGRIPPDEVKPFMAERGRVLVLPAIEGEGFPNVLTEAMSVGLPVIATDVAGICDMLEAGRAGRVVQPGRASDLVSAIHELWQDGVARKALGEVGRQSVERFSWPRVVTQWESLLASCTRQRGTP
jgi:glycosyltransferase involved in cell wall biosynthesis